MAITSFPLKSSDGNFSGFSLIIGAHDNTTVSFASNQPVGAYSIKSQVNDTTFDIYLVTPSNTFAGYTNTGALEATAEFNRLVIYGATVGDVINFEYKASVVPLSRGDVQAGAGPFLTSATPAILKSVNDTTTVTGGNFAPNVSISFIGTDNVPILAKSVVRVSSTELIVTRPDSLLVAHEPFTMVATNVGIPNPSVNVNRLANYFDAGQSVQWISTGLPTFFQNTAYSHALQATDPDTGTLSFTVVSGALPTGIELSVAGLLSGQTSGGSISTFTVRATDTGNNFTDRVFTMQGAVGLTLRTTSQSVVINASNTKFLIIGGGGAGGNGFFTTGSWPGGGSGRVVVDTIAAGTYNLVIGAGGIGANYDLATSNGGTTTFGTFSALGGVKGRDGGAGGSAGGPGVGVVGNQAGADGATGSINGLGSGGSGVSILTPFVELTGAGGALFMEGGRLTWNNTESRPAATGGRFYSGGGGTKSTNNYSVAAAPNTAGGAGTMGGGGGAGGGGASNNFTGPGDGRSGDGGNGFLAILGFL